MLYLASRSPRRQALLQRLDVPFQTLELDVPELRASGETAEGYVRRVALDKARVGLDQVRERDPQACVLGADTEVVLEDRVFGKPADLQEAGAMLGALSGRTHQVLTAVALVSVLQPVAQTVAVSRLRLAELSPAQIAAYGQSGEWMGKAGGYAIQGRAERFVIHLSGSYSGVMGLPLSHTWRLLAAYGVL